MNNTTSIVWDLVVQHCCMFEKGDQKLLIVVTNHSWQPHEWMVTIRVNDKEETLITAPLSDALLAGEQYALEWMSA